MYYAFTVEKTHIVIKEKKHYHPTTPASADAVAEITSLGSRDTPDAVATTNILKATLVVEMHYNRDAEARREDETPRLVKKRMR